MAQKYTKEEVINQINSALDSYNQHINMSKKDMYKKTSGNDELVVRNNTKKLKKAEKNEKKYDTDNYEIYIKNVLDSLQAPGADQLQWTKVIQNTCGTANNLLILIKDKKHQLAISKNPEEKERINAELQEELKSLKKLKEMIEAQKVLQELERKQLTIANQKLEEFKLNELILMAKFFTFPVKVAIKGIVDKIKEKEEKKEKEKILQEQEMFNSKVKNASKDPVFLPNKDEIGIKSSTLSVIKTDASEINSSKYDPTTLFDKKEKENKSKSSIILSAISAVSDNPISFGPSEESKVKSIILLPAHKIVVIEKDTSKNKKNKKQKKATLKQNDNEVLSANVDGKQFIVYKKVKGSQGYELVRHGDITKEQLSSGTYILSPITKDSRDIMFKDEFKDNHFTLKVKKGQKIKLGENFTEEITEYKGTTYEPQQVIQGQSLAYAKSPTMLPDRKGYGRGRHTR